MSAPPAPRPSQYTKALAPASGHNSQSGSRPGTPKVAEGLSAAAQIRLLPKPNLDESQISSLLSLTPGMG